MLEDKTTSAMLPKSWKKSFIIENFIPMKNLFCNEYNDKRMCDCCKTQTNGNKKFEANLNLIKRQTPNKFGRKRPCFNE